MEDAIKRALVLRSTEVDPEPRTERAIQDLQDAGFSVELLFWNRTGRKIDSEVDAFKRSSFNRTADYGRGLRNLSAQIAWQMWLSRRILKESNCLLYACDADTALVSALLRSYGRNKLVYDQFDQISSRFNSKILGKISVMVDVFIAARADLVIVASVQRMFKSRNKILVVSNNPDIPIVPETQRNRQEIHIAYCGVLQEDRGLMELIDVVNSLKNVRLSVAGFGPLQKEIKSKVSPSVNFLGRISKEEVILEYGRADISYVAYDPRKTNNIQTASSKIYESAIACTPSIVSEGTHLAAIVKQFGIGWVIKYGDFNELHELLTKLSDSIQPLIPDFDQKRRFFLKTFDSRQEHNNLIETLRILRTELI